MKPTFLLLVFFLFAFHFVASSANAQQVSSVAEFNASSEIKLIPVADGGSSPPANLVLVRARPSLAFAPICGSFPTSQTAAALCNMMGYHTMSASESSSVAIRPGSSTLRATFSDRDGDEVAVQPDLQDVVCSSAAWAFHNCTFRIFPSKTSTCSVFVGLRCGVLSRASMPFFFRFDPLRAGVLLARRRCSFRWSNVGATYAGPTTAGSLCRQLGYMADGSVARIAPAPTAAVASELRRRNRDATPILDMVTCSGGLNSLAGCYYLDIAASCIAIRSSHNCYNGDAKNYTNDLQILCGGKNSTSPDKMPPAVDTTDHLRHGSTEFDDCPPPLPSQRVYVEYIGGMDLQLFNVIVGFGGLMFLYICIIVVARLIYGNMHEFCDNWVFDMFGIDPDEPPEHDVELFGDDHDGDDDDDAFGARVADEEGGIPPQVKAGLLLWKVALLDPRERAVHMLQQDSTVNQDAGNVQQQLAFLAEQAERRIKAESESQQREVERQQRERQRAQRRRDRAARRRQMREQQQQQEEEEEGQEGANAAREGEGEQPQEPPEEDGEQQQQQQQQQEPTAAPRVAFGTDDEEPAAGERADAESEPGAAAAAAAAAEAREPQESDLIVAVPFSVMKWWTRDEVSSIDLRPSSSSSSADSTATQVVDLRAEAIKKSLFAGTSSLLAPGANKICFGYESALGRIQLIVGVEISVNDSGADEDDPALWRSVVLKRRGRSSALAVPFAVAAHTPSSDEELLSRPSDKNCRRVFFYTLKTFCGATEIPTETLAPFFQTLCPAPPPRESLASTPVDDSLDANSQQQQTSTSSASAATATAVEMMPLGLVSWQFSCSMCFDDKIVEISLLSGGGRIARDVVAHFPGAECSTQARHMTCSSCLGAIINDLLSKNPPQHNLIATPCFHGDCAASNGLISTEDALTSVELSVLRRLQEAKIDAERAVGQREVAFGSA